MAILIKITVRGGEFCLFLVTVMKNSDERFKNSQNQKFEKFD